VASGGTNMIEELLGPRVTTNVLKPITESITSNIYNIISNLNSSGGSSTSIYRPSTVIMHNINNVAGSLINTGSSSNSNQNNSHGITVSVNGTLVQFDVAPMVIDDRVVVQMKPIFNALGATVQWNGTDKTITATKGSTTIVLQIGSYTATVNGKTVTLVTPPLIINQHTMVPARFVSDFLGYTVTWDAANRQVDITSS
jgi:hypothetical protein